MVRNIPNNFIPLFVRELKLKNIWGNQARKDSLDSIAKAEKNMDAKTLKKSRNRRSGSASKPAKTSTVKKRRSGGSNVSSGGSARVTVRRERH
jgi:hypothetical protein